MESFQIWYPETYPPRYKLRFRSHLTLYTVSTRHAVDKLSDLPFLLCIGVADTHQKMRRLASEIALAAAQKRCNPFLWIQHKEPILIDAYWYEDMPYGMPGIVPWKRAEVEPDREGIVWKPCDPPHAKGTKLGLLMAVPDLHGIDTLDSVLYCQSDPMGDLLASSPSPSPTPTPSSTSTST